MNPSPDSTEARIEIGSPRHFGTGAAWVINAYGLLLVIPFLMSVMAISLLSFGLLTVLTPLMCVIVTAYYLPCALGNLHVTRLVRKLRPAAQAPDGFVVQLTLKPRIRSGIQAALEDADDIGWLSLAESALVFHGDAVTLSVPYDQLSSVQLRNIGIRGLWVYGQRIEITVPKLPGVESFTVAERASWLLPTSRRTTRELFQRLAARAKTN